MLDNAKYLALKSQSHQVAYLLTLDKNGKQIVDKLSPQHEKMIARKLFLFSQGYC